MFRSYPVWAILIACIGRAFAFEALSVLKIWYMRSTLNVNSSESDIMDQCFLALGLAALLSGVIADFFIAHKIVTTTIVRKLFHFVGFAGESICLIIFGYVIKN